MTICIPLIRFLDYPPFPYLKWSKDAVMRLLKDSGAVFDKDTICSVREDYRRNEVIFSIQPKTTK